MPRAGQCPHCIVYLSSTPENHVLEFGNRVREVQCAGLGVSIMSYE